MSWAAVLTKMMTKEAKLDNTSIVSLFKWTLKNKTIIWSFLLYCPYNGCDAHIFAWDNNGTKG